MHLFICTVCFMCSVGSIQLMIKEAFYQKHDHYMNQLKITLESLRYESLPSTSSIETNVNRPAEYQSPVSTNFILNEYKCEVVMAVERRYNIINEYKQL